MRSCKLPNSRAMEVRGVSHGRSCNHSTAGLMSDASVTAGNVVNFVNDGSKRNATAASGESLVICIVPASGGAVGNIWNVNVAL